MPTKGWLWWLIVLGNLIGAAVALGAGVPALAAVRNPLSRVWMALLPVCGAGVLLALVALVVARLRPVRGGPTTLIKDDRGEVAVRHARAGNPAAAAGMLFFALLALWCGTLAIVGWQAVHGRTDPWSATLEVGYLAGFGGLACYFGGFPIRWAAGRMPAGAVVLGEDYLLDTGRGVTVRLPLAAIELLLTAADGCRMVLLVGDPQSVQVVRTPIWSRRINRSRLSVELRGITASDELVRQLNERIAALRSI